MVDLEKWDKIHASQNKKNIINSEKVGWQNRLDKTEEGVTKYTYQNLKLIFDNDPHLKNIFAFDSFRNIEILTAKPVWNRVVTSGTDTNSPLTDTDATQIRNYIRDKYNMGGDKTKLFEDLIQEKSLQNAFNPVLDYLNKCHQSWNKKPSIEKIGHEFLGLTDTEYHNEAFKTMLVGAVARAFEPGVKFDYMGIIFGSQGIGKSTFLRKIGGEWFSDSLTGMSSKDDVQVTLGAWLIEDGELTALKNTPIHQAKHFITKVMDTIRLPYGRRTTTYARRFTLWGTTNQQTFLYDKTGTRRFLIFKADIDRATKSVFDDLTQDVIDQLWGEAVQLYKEGFKLSLPTDLEKEAQTVREEFQNVDMVKELLGDYLEIPLPLEWDKLEVHQKRFYINDMLNDYHSPKYKGVNPRDRVTVKEVMSECFKMDYKDSATTQYKKQSKEVREALREMDGWEYKDRLKINKKVTSGFKRK